MGRQSPRIRPSWFVERMRERIQQIDWRAVREDVRRFLPHRDQEGLNLWSSELFLYHANQMAGYLSV